MAVPGNLEAAVKTEKSRLIFTVKCREGPVPNPECFRDFGIGEDESARNEISILIAGMTRPMCRELHISTVSVEILLKNPVNYLPAHHR